MTKPNFSNESIFNELLLNLLFFTHSQHLQNSSFKRAIDS